VEFRVETMAPESYTLKAYLGSRQREVCSEN